jgi:hypothetical protein
VRRDACLQRNRSRDIQPGVQLSPDGLKQAGESQGATPYDPLGIESVVLGSVRHDVDFHRSSEAAAGVSWIRAAARSSRFSSATKAGISARRQNPLPVIVLLDNKVGFVSRFLDLRERHSQHGRR